MRNIKAMILVSAIVCFIISGNISAQEAEPGQIVSDELNQTAVTCYMQEKISKGENLLYCSTFQIAWDKLCDEVLKEPLKLSGNPVAQRMLNERLTGEDDISEDYYLAMAGFNRDNIVEKIKKALKEKFDETPGLDLTLENPDDILAYAFLLKDLKFDKEFESLDKPIMFNGNIPVQAFGIKEYSFTTEHAKLSRQLDILDYRDDNNFIVGLKSSSPKDEIILAKITPKGTLLETVEFVLSRIKSQPPSKIRDGETLRIPKLDFDLLHFYSELTGRDFLNKGFKMYSISQAVQSIRLRLNEKGALLKSEAAIVAMTAIPDPSPKPREFIFDKPFLILLKEKGARYPYFAMWVDNSELLLKK